PCRQFFDQLVNSLCMKSSFDNSSDEKSCGLGDVWKSRLHLVPDILDVGLIVQAVEDTNYDLKPGAAPWVANNGLPIGRDCVPKCRGRCAHRSGSRLVELDHVGGRHLDNIAQPLGP